MLAVVLQALIVTLDRPSTSPMLVRLEETITPQYQTSLQAGLQTKMALGAAPTRMVDLRTQIIGKRSAIITKS